MRIINDGIRVYFLGDDGEKGGDTGNETKAQSWDAGSIVRFTCQVAGDLRVRILMRPLPRDV